MEELLKILSSYNEDADFMKENAIIDDEIIDSIDVTSLISDIEDTFEIKIGMKDIVPENFNTVNAMWEMIQHLKNG